MATVLDAVLIAVCVLCAGVVATMMLILFVHNGRVQRSNEQLERENASLRRELKKARDELSRRSVRLASHAPRRHGW